MQHVVKTKILSQTDIGKGHVQQRIKKVKNLCIIKIWTFLAGICITNDIDTLLYHMNNARYFRELDFARVDFYERTNLYRTIVAKGGSVFQGAATIRYRKFIRPLSVFTIASRVSIAITFF